MQPNLVHPALALVAYAEDLCRGARVLVVGDARSPLAAALIDRGARLVHVCDRDAARRAEAGAKNAHRSVTFGSLDDGPSALREGFFDLGLIENLSGEGDPKKSVAFVSRLLAARGSMFVSAPNPEVTEPLVSGTRARQTLDYYALYDAVAGAFPRVRMLGQVPFVAYAVVDFSHEGEPSPVLDASLLPARGEEPDYFVAFGAREPHELDEYAVIQLPSSALKIARPKADATPVVSNPELERRIAQQEAWIAELEGRATAADERADAAEAELDELRERVANREQSDAHRENAVGTGHQALRAELEQAKRRAGELEELLTQKTGELAAELAAKASAAEQAAELAARANDAEHSVELGELEGRLVERGHEVRRLEQQLQQAERTGRELVRKLEGRLAVPAAPSGVSERLAEAEAELVALRWSLEISTRVPGAAGLG